MANACMAALQPFGKLPGKRLFVPIAMVMEGSVWAGWFSGG